MIAIAVAIAAVAVIAAAAVMMSGNGGGGEKQPVNPDDVPLGVDTNVSKTDLDALKATGLPVFGNADGDLGITQKDADLIRNMVSQKASLSSHPLADANRDGKVTEDDAKIVEKMVKGEKTRVWFMDQYEQVSGTPRLVEVEYPLGNVVAINPDMVQLLLTFDGDRKLAGYAANNGSYPVMFNKVDNNGFTKCLGTTPRSIGQAEWVALKNLSGDLYNKGQSIGAVLAYNETALGDYQDDLKAAGIPVAYIRCTDPVLSIDAVVLLGFLYGPEYAKIANEYREDCRQALVDISDAVSKVSENDKTRFIAMCMWRYVSHHDSQYTKIGLQAGGVDVANLPGDGSTQLQDPEALAAYNGKVDVLLNCRTLDFKNADPVATWENSSLDMLKKSSAFEDMFFLNMSLPTPCRILYATSMFYPDVISKDACDDYFQNIVDKYLPYLHGTVEDGRFDVKTDVTTVMTYQDYLDAKGEGPEPGTLTPSEDVVALAERFFGIMGPKLNDPEDMKDGNKGFSYAPYALSGDNGPMEAKVESKNGSYFVKYSIVEDAAGKYKSLTKEYETKIGTSFRGGVYAGLPFSNGLAESMGYYINTSDSDPVKTFCSVKFAGYKGNCLVEMQFLCRPSMSLDELGKLVDAAYPSSSSVSAEAWAKAFKTSVLDGYAGAPYSLADGATPEKASVSDSEGKRFVSFRSGADAFSTFSSKKAEYMEKSLTETLDVSGFDDGYGMIVQRTNGGGFWMMYFAGMKDGCFVDVALRNNDSTGFSAAEAQKVLSEILSSEPA